MAEYNNLAALNEVLFEQLERINNADAEQLESEISRAKAITIISGNILESGKLSLDAAKFADSALSANTQVPKMLGGS